MVAAADQEYTGNSEGVGTKGMRGEQTREGFYCWDQMTTRELEEGHRSRKDAM